VRATLRRARYDDDEQWPAVVCVSPRFSQSVSDPVRLQSPQVSAPSTATTPRWLDPTILRLTELLDLPKNWDQRGSAAVRRDAASFTLTVLSQVMPPTAPAPAIIPLGHGGLQLLWSNARSDLEVEVLGPNDVVSYHLDKSSGTEDERVLTTEFSPIIDVLWSRFR
jgi:hypothetical protein